MHDADAAVHALYRRGGAAVPVIAKSFERIRRGISVKFQVPGIFKALSVRQNLLFGAQGSQHVGALTVVPDDIVNWLDLGGVLDASYLRDAPRPFQLRSLSAARKAGALQSAP